MTFISSLIGFATTHNSPCSPTVKASASVAPMKLHVIASSSPRAAAARRTRRSARCAGVAVGLATPASRGSGVARTRSNPAIRATSSTRSASPSISGRQLGGITPSPSRSNPRAARIAKLSLSANSSPANPATRSGRNDSVRGATIAAQSLLVAVTGALTSPPHSSTIIAEASMLIASSSAGSTPRSNRARASVISPCRRPVIATLVGSNQAHSSMTSVVVSETPVSAPPMTPPKPSTARSSAMTQSAGSTA